VRSAGDLAGFFEYDDETGYFYLYDQPRGPGHRIVDAIRVLNTRGDFQQQDVKILWDPSERYVGLLIRSQLWAAFDTKTGAKYGGDYRVNTRPALPTEVISIFDRRPRIG